MPPPAAIEPGVPYSGSEAAPGGYGPHFELLASGETPNPDAHESTDAPAPELLSVPISNEPPDASELSQGHVEAVAEMVESPVEAAAPEPELSRGNEPEVIPEAILEDGEPLSASIPDEPPDETGMSHEPEPLEGYGDGFEALAVPEPDDSPGGRSASDAAASEAKALESAPAVLEQGGPETPRESEPEAIEMAAHPLLKESDAASGPSVMENGFIPLVRDARGDWRPGKGFSRSELRDAGFSPAEATRLGIRVDKRRRNAHPMNVATLERAKSGV